MKYAQKIRKSDTTCKPTGSIFSAKDACGIYLYM